MSSAAFLDAVRLCSYNKNRYHCITADATNEDPRAMLDAIDADPTNLELRWSVAARFSLDGEHEDALREFLEIVKRDRKFKDDGARKAILSMFALLGSEHELVTLFRRRLSLALS